MKKTILTLAIALVMFVPAPAYAGGTWKTWLCDTVHPFFPNPNGLVKWCGTGRAWERNSG